MGAAMMSIPGVFTTAAEVTAAVGVASIGGVVNVAGLAISGAIGGINLALATPLESERHSYRPPASPRPEKKRGGVASRNEHPAWDGSTWFCFVLL
mmetsp:Transcript_28503/g.46022  ORF Transcript_28503/g.46022 Transcript_28503/m.46022 type:complete len:96 (+) Transcript_28503:115-402(+)